jgi:two-component system, NtrC family, sensor histidine kinase HydH
VASDGGRFERAMLFTINERSGTLQGMLGVDRHTASLALPPERGLLAWERPAIGEDVQEAQRRAEFCRQVMKQRLSLDANDNALARAVSKGRIVLISHPETESSSGAGLAEALQLAPYACAPLMGRSRPLGVLVVDNPESLDEITADRLRFLEMFAGQAGAAMENSMLLHRLETAHQDLRETQERLIQGEKLAVLGEMSASVAHELKNPLVSIGGFAQRLSRITSADSMAHEYSTIIAREVRRMEEMLSSILAFSKKQMLCFTMCNIVDIVEEALMLEMDGLGHASIKIVKEFSPDIPKVHCDEQKLRQVIINLIANSRQAMMDFGTLIIRVQRSLLRGDLAVAIEIEDTGGGISPEIMHNIFNPFFSTKDKGTGLGLSISHRIIEHHKGEIEVQNRTKGVVFIIRLPTHHSPAHLSIDKHQGFG